MCAITGVWSFSGEHISEGDFELFNNSLSHRGPDGHGVFSDLENRITLGHRRLSIIDLTSTGAQPMQCNTGRYYITYNGEIFNYLELRSELINYGYEFKSLSDTEVILNAFKKWGENCVNYFNGMWAFAIWDSYDGSLFLSRDRFGVKPLYYVRCAKYFAFASESGAFNNLKIFRKQINNRNAAVNINNVTILEGMGETIFDGLHKLRAGHNMVIYKTGDFSVYKWYNLLNEIDVNKKGSNLKEDFLNLFTDSCKLRLRSDVPIGVALSGGLDSSTIYGLISKLLSSSTGNRNELRAFIASFPGTSMDEKDYADQVVKFCGGSAIHITSQNIQIDKIIKQIKHEDFVYMSPPVVHSIYKEMKINGVSVSLDGHGVDEMLFGYPDMVYEWWANEENLAIKHDLSKTWGLMQDGMQFLENVSLSNDKQNFFKRIYDMSPFFLKEIYRKTRFELDKGSFYLKKYPYLDSQRKEIEEISDLQLRIAYRNFIEDKLPTILRNWDRASMSHGVEIRMPFMDYRLVEFIFSLDGSHKINKHYTKSILREAASGLIPEDIRLRRNKIGINAPMVEWFNGSFNNFILDITRSKNFVESNIWNGRLVGSKIEKLCSTKSWTQSDCNQFWPYINTSLLMP